MTSVERLNKTIEELEKLHFSLIVNLKMFILG